METRSILVTVALALMWLGCTVYNVLFYGHAASLARRWRLHRRPSLDLPAQWCRASPELQRIDWLMGTHVVTMLAENLRVSREKLRPDDSFVADLAIRGRWLKCDPLLGDFWCALEEWMGPNYPELCRRYRHASSPTLKELLLAIDAIQKNEAGGTATPERSP